MPCDCCCEPWRAAKGTQSTRPVRQKEQGGRCSAKCVPAQHKKSTWPSGVALPAYESSQPCPAQHNGTVQVALCNVAERPGPRAKDNWVPGIMIRTPWCAQKACHGSIVHQASLKRNFKNKLWSFASCQAQRPINANSSTDAMPIVHSTCQSCILPPAASQESNSNTHATTSYSCYRQHQTQKGPLQRYLVQSGRAAAAASPLPPPLTPHAPGRT